MSNQPVVNQSVDVQSNQNTSNTSNTANVKTAGNGLKPLYYAGLVFFQNVLVPKLESAINNFEAWKYDVVKSKFEYATIQLPDMNDKLVITCDDGSEKSYVVADVHYAPRKSGGKFTERDFDAWPRMNSCSPFRSAQYYMLQRGFYLVEESDPSKSRKVVLKLYKTKSPYPEQKLWHNHNKIHGVYSTTSTTSTFVEHQKEKQVEQVEQVKQHFKKQHQSRGDSRQKHKLHHGHPTNNHNKQNFKKTSNVQPFTEDQFPALKGSHTIPNTVSLVKSSESAELSQSPEHNVWNNNTVQTLTKLESSPTEEPTKPVELVESQQSK